jgi:lipopolysaccharide export system protein LptA
VPTVASAQDLDYDDQARRATYTTDAHVNGPQGDLIARRIEMYLAKGDNQLERVEGYEGVTVREAGRSATGDRLSYFSADGRYDMQGTPVRIVEDCRDSTGRTLTFYKSSDRILVDGQQVSRTRSKSGRECSAPPR